jgi:Putative Actinobacterial Holin-X, holin superfamily III
MILNAAAGTRGLGALLRDLAEGSVTLLRSEVELARDEITAAVSRLGAGIAMIAVGGVLAVLGGLAVLCGFIMLVGDQWLPHDRYWLAALLVGIVAGAIAFWFGKRGRGQLAPSLLTPDETLTTLLEDGEWLKRQLKSGETSS